MTLLSPALRQRLTRARLAAGGATATAGVGERRSRVKGEGIEFEDHREYQPGDDLRRLDPHLYARFGEAYVRQYNVGRQLTITILLDTSASMGHGSPSKQEWAAAAATGLSVAGLAGSDAVQGAVLHDGTATWHPRVSGSGRLDTVERWLNSRSPTGATDIAASVATLGDRFTGSGLTFLISDLWSDGLQQLVDQLAHAGQSLVVVHVLAPEELDPTLLGSGALQLSDAESGDETSVTIGPEQVEAYRRLLDEWIDAARQTVVRRGGAFVTVPSDTSLDDFFMRVLPGLGVLR